jgi:uncharacterized membrane protein YheB (UPF0754 family)
MPLDFASVLPSWAPYLVIPVISALIGWGTNVVAIKMTFRPLEFVGMPPIFGWQGIIPSKARKMAGKAVDLITEKLVTVREVVAKIRAERVVDELEEGVSALTREIIDEVVAEHLPELWETLPSDVKEQIYAEAAAEAPEVIEASVEEIKDDIEGILDLEQMAIEALVEAPELLNRIFLEAGSSEFQFIQRSGLYFGFLFGLVQMVLWFQLDAGWVLPAVGTMVGFATNVLALKMIFWPVEPVEIAGFEWQGLFHKRQDEVSEAYARLVAEHVVTTRDIMRRVLEGPMTDRLLEIVERHIEHAAEDYTAPGESIVRLAVGSEGYREMKANVVDRIVQELPETIYEAEDYVDDALDIERTLRERLEALEPAEFEQLLRPVFQEDEWKLIAVGAALGGIAGSLQLVVV